MKTTTTRKPASATWRLLRARAVRAQTNNGTITPATAAAALWALYANDYQLALVDIARMRRWMRDGLVEPTPPVVESLELAELLALDARDDAIADLVDAERG